MTLRRRTCNVSGMSAFVDSPKGLHIGQCQNFLYDSAGVGRYCLAPVIGLGAEFPADRDICGMCEINSQEFTARLLRSKADDLAHSDSLDEWLETIREHISDMDRHYYLKARNGAEMGYLFEYRRKISLREMILDSVESAIRERGERYQCSEGQSPAW